MVSWLVRPDLSLSSKLLRSKGNSACWFLLRVSSDLMVLVFLLWALCAMWFEFSLSCFECAYFTSFFNGFFVLNLSSFWFACWIAWIHFAYFVRSGSYIAAPYVFFLWFVIFVAKIYNWAWITHYSVFSFDLCLFGTQLNLYLLHANGLIEDYDSCSQTQPIRVVFLKILNCDIDAA